MKKYSLLLLVMLSLNTEALSQTNYRKFYRKIISTYNQINSKESELDLLNKAIDIRNKNRTLLVEENPCEFCALPECDEEYEFITIYRVKFKKMCSAKKKKLKREKYFNYLSTRVLNRSETYVYCNEGTYIGNIRKSVSDDYFFIYGDSIKILAENLYEQIYLKTKPVLFFCTTMPVIQDFIVLDDSIKPIDYDKNYNWIIYEMNEFISNKERFKYKNDYMSNGYMFVE